MELKRTGFVSVELTAGTVAILEGLSFACPDLHRAKSGTVLEPIIFLNLELHSAIPFLLINRVVESGLRDSVSVIETLSVRRQRA